MNENFKIEVQLTNGGGTALELANVTIDAVLYMQGRVRYRFCSGKTDARGCLCVTFDQLENSRLKNQSFSIMEYNTRLQECDPRVSFVVPSLNELQQRQTAIEKWFPEDASKAEDIEESNNGKLLCETIDVNVELSKQKVFLACEYRD